MSTKINYSIVLFLLLIIFLEANTVLAQETFHRAGLAMGTIIRFTLVATNESVADQAADSAFAAISRLEKDFDHRDANGSIGRVNGAAGIKSVDITADAFALIERSLEFCDKTKGVFDITIGAITLTPNYYENLSGDKKSLVNYKLVQLNQEEQTVFLPKKGMALDLGGIAKGTIIDSAAAAIRRQEGISAGIVEAGGDFFCFGDKSWKVGIQHPRQEGLLGIIEISNRGVCGSGDYYQYIIEEDSGQQERKHHIIDPAKKRSATKSISVTVVAPTAEMSDALATALFIMGPEAGQAFLKDQFPDIAVLWITPDLELIKSETFPQFLIE